MQNYGLLSSRKKQKNIYLQKSRHTGRNNSSSKNNASKLILNFGIFRIFSMRYTYRLTPITGRCEKHIENYPYSVFLSTRHNFEPESNHNTRLST